MQGETSEDDIELDENEEDEEEADEGEGLVPAHGTAASPHAAGLFPGQPGRARRRVRAARGGPHRMTACGECGPKVSIRGQGTLPKRQLGSAPNTAPNRLVRSAGKFVCGAANSTEEQLLSKHCCIFGLRWLQVLAFSLFCEAIIACYCAVGTCT